MNVNDLLVELDKRDTLLANDAASTIRELLREVEKNTTPAVPPDLIRCNSTRLNTAGEVMELASRYAVAFLRSRELSDEAPERLALLAAITKLVSDRDVLLEANSRCVWCLIGLGYEGDPTTEFARAAIQKVQP